MKFKVTNKVIADKYGYPHNKEVVVDDQKLNKPFVDDMVQRGDAVYVVEPEKK